LGCMNCGLSDRGPCLLDEGDEGLKSRLWQG
jgi:hypothetical protein